MPVADISGTLRWYNKEKMLHREDGPAVLYKDGSEEWYIDGYLHREDGPAVYRKWGRESWLKAWWIIGKGRHREDGPAEEYSSGAKVWWYNGQNIDCETQEEFERLIKLDLFW